MNPNLKPPDQGLNVAQLADYFGEQINRLNLVLKNLDGINLKRVDFNLVGGGFIRLDRKGLVINDGTRDVVTVDTEGNASFTGHLEAESGEIGGWTIESNKLTGGQIEAGLIYSTTILASLIQTDGPGNYPRAEMSNTEKLFKVELDEDQRIGVEAAYSGSPTFTMVTPNAEGVLVPLSSISATFLRVTKGNVVIQSDFGNAELKSLTGSVFITSGSDDPINLSCDDLIINGETGMTTAVSTGTDTLHFKNGLLVDIT